MVLSSKNIRLRAVEPIDLDTLYLWENSPEAWEAGSAVVTPLSKFTLEQYIQTAHMGLYEAGQLRLMIDIEVFKKDYTTIGTIDLFDFNSRNMTAGIGILIYEKQYRRRGYASQALAILIDYVFGVLHLHQLYCSMLRNNKASEGLFLKQGFLFVGTLHQWFRTPNGWEDENLYQLMNKNY